MCRKLIYLVSFVLVLSLIPSSLTKAADPDLIGWWKLDEGSGDTAIDSSGSGNDGTINNAASGGHGPGGSTWFDDPERGMVLSFNGDNSSGAYVSTDEIIPAMNMDNDFTWAFWAKQHQDQGTEVPGQGNDLILGNRYASDGSDPLEFIKFTPGNFEYYNNDPDYTVTINYDDIPAGVWIHHTGVKDGTTLTYYRNGVETGTSTITFTIRANPFYMAGEPSGERWSGWLSDVRIYNRALSAAEIRKLAARPKAWNPSPADSALHEDTWVSLGWSPGDYAVSHDVYLGDNFADVDAGIEDTFRGNQTDTFFVAGFPGFPFPEGLIPGTTYYWRIDEVNDADPNSPWKGDVWSFMVPPKTAYFPNPADGAELIDPDVELTWTAGFGAKLHTVYLDDNFDDVNSATQGAPWGLTTYTPDTLKLEKTYYWRVDEFDIVATHKGDVWSFTTLGARGNPEPANGATGVKMTATLSWQPGDSAASHQVYFGTDKDAVRNATTASPEYKGTTALGSESYDPGKLAWLTTYYWRVDEVNNVHPNSPWIGPVWSFTTADFIVVDDFESYNDLDPDMPGSNRIFLTWIDGYDTPLNGSQVGYTDPPFCEQTIVHGGRQSMPLFYDNSGPANYSEATLPLTYPRDWTEEEVGVLTLWFYGNPTNAAESVYVAVSNATGPTAVVYHDNPDAALINAWTPWNINLEEISNQGVILTNVDSIAIGFGNRNNPQVGGSGIVFIDDIRLYRPATEL